MIYNPWYYYIETKLIKKRKPCLPDQYVHIKNWMGCYRVIDVKINHFVIMKNRELKNISWDNLLCLKGQGQSVEAEIKRKLANALVLNQLLGMTIINEIKSLKLG